MAKENGFKTYFYSAYDMKQTNLIGVRYIDEMVTSEHNPRKFKHKKEDLLLKMFKNLDLKNGKNFVVLNFKSVHSPYEENYSHHKEFDVFKPKDDSRFEEENAAYDNAILYVDSIFGQLLEEFERLNVANSQFIFTSDHGEMLGFPDGRYGLCLCRYCAYSSDFLCGNLCSAWPHGSCRRRSGSRVQCTDDRLCRDVFPGE